jgi:hypothetical protein
VFSVPARYRTVKLRNGKGSALEVSIQTVDSSSAVGEGREATHAALSHQPPHKRTPPAAHKPTAPAHHTTTRAFIGGIACAPRSRRCQYTDTSPAPQRVRTPISARMPHSDSDATPVRSHATRHQRDTVAATPHYRHGARRQSRRKRCAHATVRPSWLVSMSGNRSPRCSGVHARGHTPRTPSGIQAPATRHCPRQRTAAAPRCCADATPNQSRIAAHSPRHHPLTLSLLLVCMHYPASEHRSPYCFRPVCCST